MTELFYGLLGLAFVFLILGSWILPWVQREQLRRLEEQLELMSYRLDRLMPSAPVAPPAPEAEAPAARPEAPKVEVAPPLEEAPSVLPEIKTKENNFERNFGAKLPVWIGGLALALAGFFMVRYSIEAGLLGPGMRVILGLLFGAGLVGAAHKFGPHDARVGQSLAGAGVAVLYTSLFAASALYHLVAPAYGFIGMAMTTALAVVLALRHGAPIAVMGLVGGFLTPLMVGSHDGNTPLLLTYLYILFTALLWFIRRTNWWGLSLLLAPFALGYAVFLILFGDLEALFLSGVFLLAISLTLVKLTRGLADETVHVFGLSRSRITKGLNYAVLTFAAMLIGMATAQSDYTLQNRALLGLLTAGALVLARFDQKLYAFAPWLALGVNIAVLGAEDSSQTQAMVGHAALLMLLYGAASARCFWRTSAPRYWALLNVASLLGLFLTAFYALHESVVRVTVWPLISFPFWSLTAALLAGHLVMRCYRIVRADWPSEDLRQYLLAIYATGATAFVTLALVLQLERETLSVAVALEVLALSWLYSRLHVAALRPLAGVLTGVFTLLLLPQLLLLGQVGTLSLFEVHLGTAQVVPLAQWPLFQLGLPALALLGASLLLRRKGDGKLIGTLEGLTIALLGLMAYTLSRQYFHPGENIMEAAPAGFIERGAFTNILLFAGLGLLALARRYSRPVVHAAGLLLGGMALLRIGWFDLVLHNPLFDGGQHVGTTPLFNALLLTFGLPLLGLASARRYVTHAGLQKVMAVSALVLMFALLSFEVRQAFHGADLSEGLTTNAELYTYSAVWLLFGLGLLVIGTQRKDRALRVAALCLTTLAVAKVFLVDASNLTGLWRVFSFLGLGLSLIGLSWFYNRFIFRRDV